MSSFKRGLGKSFDKIFGEGKVDETKVSEINKPKENEVIEFLKPFPTFFTDRIRFLSNSV